MFEEKWKDIRGNEGFYEISNLGRVRKCSLVVITDGKIKVNKRRLVKPRLTNNNVEYYPMHVHGRKAERFYIKAELASYWKEKDRPAKKKGRPRIKRAIPVEIKPVKSTINQYKGSEFISGFKSSRHASMFTGISKDEIEAVLDHAAYKAGGYFWKTK